MAGIAADLGTRANAFARKGEDGLARLDLVVEGIHCAKCIRDIETGVGALPGIVSARVNFTTKRLHVVWQEGALGPEAITAKLDELGFKGLPIETTDELSPDEKEARRLLLCLGVAGFAAGNVMLLSVSVWAGVDMGPATRTILHWISAVIALPTVVFAGQPFFISAWKALKARRLNMDVPISLAVILACALSIAETQAGGQHAYFDAAVMLLFFLLIGRYLDFNMRAHARSAATELMAIQRLTAQVVGEDGALTAVPASTIRPGDLLFVPQGERVPVDGTLEAGVAEFDMSLLTGETTPARVAAGDQVFGGTINLSGPLTVRAAASSENSTLAEIVRMMETAEQSRARYVRLADRAARVYAPAVHLLAAATFIGWWLIPAVGWELAATNAIAVLIITCPCALGLAVPVVQVVASGQLFRRGILGKTADGIERLAEVDWVVFDKTGTLTMGAPRLIEEGVDRAVLTRAAELARASTHPLSRALAEAAGPGAAMDDVIDMPGEGLEAETSRGMVRLGRAAWCGAEASAHAELELWFRDEAGRCTRFRFRDELRPDAADTVARLRAMGMGVELLSGDRDAAVAEAAKAAGIDHWQAECRPDGKIARLEALRAEGKRVLMVGDGLNDAPSLAAAHASLSPASAAEISQAAADFVFQGADLGATVFSIRMARLARTLVFQNFGLAFLYNCIAVPLAVLGFVTPLIAALAMSGSSIVVTLNALRLTWLGRR